MFAKIDSVVTNLLAKESTNEAIEQSMRMHIAHLMVANDAPTEQFERLGRTDDLAVVSDST